MPIGMGATNLNLVKGGRKLKKEKHYTTPKLEQNDRKRTYEFEKLKLKEKATLENM